MRLNKASKIKYAKLQGELKYEGEIRQSMNVKLT